MSTKRSEPHRKAGDAKCGHARSSDSDPYLAIGKQPARMSASGELAAASAVIMSGGTVFEVLRIQNDFAKMLTPRLGVV